MRRWVMSGHRVTSVLQVPNNNKRHSKQYIYILRDSYTFIIIILENSWFR